MPLSETAEASWLKTGTLQRTQGRERRRGGRPAQELTEVADDCGLTMKGDRELREGIWIGRAQKMNLRLFHMRAQWGRDATVAGPLLERPKARLGGPRDGGSAGRCQHSYPRFVSVREVRARRPFAKSFKRAAPRDAAENDRH